MPPAKTPLFIAAGLSLLFCFIVLERERFNPYALAKDYGIDIVNPHNGVHSTPEVSLDQISQKTLPCRQLPGSEDVLVVMKTGATEAHKKLPVHFETTFRCTPHYAIFSDLDEEIDGHVVHDTLDGIPEDTKNTSPEFEFYQQMRNWHSAGTDLGALPADDRQKAWDLDKWKFLPLMEKALKTRPQSKWYVFIEADTYLVWSNLLQWLAGLDHMDPLYIGGQNYMGDTLFAHGGTGFIVSQRALSMLVRQYNANPAAFTKMIQNDYAGDVILSKAFQTVNITLTPAWPILQGETPYTLDYTDYHLCFPVVSYHHMPPEWVKRMWDYEQIWISGPQRNQTPLRHRDVFEHFVAPEISTGDKIEWNNISNDDEEEVSGEEDVSVACRARCEAQTDCLQWLYFPGKCNLGNVVRLGSANAANDIMVAGWMVDRINAFKESVEPCKQDWIKPEDNAT